VKEVVDGIPVFRPEAVQGEARDAMVRMPQLMRTARAEGSGEVDGEATDVLVIDDAAALAEVFGGMGGPFQPSRMEIQVARDDHLMRQITITGNATGATGQASPITTVVRLEDWRTTDGFAYPFRTTSTTEGLGGMVPGGTGQMDAAMAEMERQIDQLPEAQREAARQAMSGRMEAARQAASGAPLETVITVKELRVSRGGD
jgi:hypothetical protein